MAKRRGAARPPSRWRRPCPSDRNRVLPTLILKMSDDELRTAAASIIETRVSDRRTRERALAELADATIVRRGNVVGFLVPALDGWDDEGLSGVVEQRFTRVVLAGTQDRLEQDLEFA